MLIRLREELNIAFEDNYLSYKRLQKKVKEEPELKKKLSEVVEILETNFASEKEIITDILNKIPENLYKLLLAEGLKSERNLDQIEKYRR